MDEATRITMQQIGGIPASDSWLVPEWPAPGRVRALTTTRLGGVSRAPYNGLNLAQHVGDERSSVRANRDWLKQALALPDEPAWLCQVHGTNVVEVGAASTSIPADGSYSRTAGRVCGVLTADCLPVVLCERSGAAVGVVHAGWKGLLAGVLEAAVDAIGVSPGEQLMAWLGPAIGPASFEVGEELRSAFIEGDPAAAAAFEPGTNGKWYADLYLLAKQRLARRGIRDIYGGDFCTCRERTRFFSYRRDGITGRMATLAWLEP